MGPRKTEGEGDEELTGRRLAVCPKVEVRHASRGTNPGSDPDLRAFASSECKVAPKWAHSPLSSPLALLLAPVYVPDDPCCARASFLCSLPTSPSTSTVSHAKKHVYRTTAVQHPTLPDRRVVPRVEEESV